MHVQWTGVCYLPAVKGDVSAGLLAERIADFPGTSSSKNFTFHSDKMGGKDHCCITTG